MDLAHAEALDAADTLAGFRDAFELPQGLIYLDGNSLGPLPRATAPRLDALVRREWGEKLITSWNGAGWIEAPERVGGKIARLIGAKAGEVVAADSTSTNLFKVAAGALSLRPGRRTIVTERGNFHTDIYVLEGLCAVAGATLKVVEPDEVLAAIDDDTAAVVLTHVHYKTARRWDMAGVTAAAHARGALAIWDLSHTTGALAVDLHAARADLAVGCGYKYLNGGPGAPAFLFVAERHQGAIAQPLSGWMGHAAPFAFEDSYRPAGDIRRLLCGTPPILGLAALEAGVDLQLQADPKAVEAKGLALCDLFIRLTEARCAGHGLELVGPREADARGLHVSFAHPDAYAIVQALIARGVVGDFRDPDVARFGFSPLYLRFADVWDAVEILREVMAARAFDTPEFRSRAAVT
ncbi:MAG: kynureninase [Phenylobacterium sp.]|uniref:kynureninase n=1 Tax=Phenylobacterium sp. TaxID=1871053 RepID=UPI0025EFF6B3|nr:kynureninase [Phenylobacterium sp.]MBI1197541.1 kynureninase [Phenylobacterium sp.]